MLEKVQENGPAGRRKKKDKTEKVIGLRRRTREEIVKWNQMTALRFQTGERHNTSPAPLLGPPGGLLAKTSDFNERPQRLE